PSGALEVLDQRGIADGFLAEGKKAQATGFAGVPFDLSGFPTRHPYSGSARRICGLGGRSDPAGARGRANHLVRTAYCGIAHRLSYLSMAPLLFCHISYELTGLFCESDSAGPMIRPLFSLRAPPLYLDHVAYHSYGLRLAVSSDQSLSAVPQLALKSLLIRYLPEGAWRGPQNS